MTASFGKKLVLAGFAGRFAVVLLSYFIVSNVFSYISLLCLLIAAAGFGIMWRNDWKMINLLIAGTVGLAALATLFWPTVYTRLLFDYDITGTVISLLSFFLFDSYRIFWGLKFKNNNPLVAVLLALALLGSFFGFNLIYRIGLPAFFGYALDIGLCAIPVVAAYFEED